MPTEQIDTSYLDQKLQSEINPELTMAKNPQTSSAEVLQHPPEVGTLREWGQYVFAGREAQRKDLQRGLQGSELCVSTTKPQGSFTVGQKFPVGPTFWEMVAERK
jgi:hypothetical protein